MGGGTTSATGRTVGGNEFGLILRRWAFVVGKALSLDSPVAGGRSGASNPSCIATNSRKVITPYLYLSAP
jgi:hypothetical protein